MGLSYRFVRDRKRWRAFAERRNTDPFSLVTYRLAGAASIDRNEDHLALAEMNRLGDLARIRRIRRNLQGKSKEQTRAILRDGSREIRRACGESGNFLLIESLDLRRSKLKLESVAPVRACSFSSLTYAKAIAMAQSRLFLLPESRGSKSTRLTRL
ncbi:hypothetical protein [Candidatus Methylacidithermus pantelleriae]|uniref:Uncharacterized protein n=1 Tax=Candidatus Methylacidithermus pantelleriae TaxID=2744239 RepID=A0A8J2FW61_9BACT|nr:hypothetical protein [Candidatus Methylacidithermus pantelleriae]CAF0697464.1 hypothetical protein MPNT_220009 [Candidatus Methylacidithermus pantelleriae]